MKREELAKRLLPLLKETLAPLLPVKIVFEDPLEQAHLYFQGIPLARVNLEANGLSPEEVSRWQPAVLALTQELWQRLLREKCIEGLPGIELLGRELKTRPLTGLILKGPKPEQASYALQKGVYFLEGSSRELLPLLKDYWRKGVKMTAVSVTWRSIDDLDQVDHLLYLAEALGFTWLSSKAQKGLQGHLLQAIPAPKVLAPLLKAWEGGATLLWAEGPATRLQNLDSLAQESLALGNGEILLAFSGPVSEVKEFIEDLGLKAGIYREGADLPPLAATWAALEHARRLPDPTAIVFEPFTYHVAGDLYLDLGDLGAAQKCYLLGRQGTAQPVDLLNSLAVIMVQLGLRKEAQKYLEEAIAQNPKDPLLHYNLGLFFQEEKAPEAKEAFRQAYILAPQERVFTEAWAEVLAQEGRWTEVEKVLDQVPLSPQGLFLKARALYEQGRLEQAFSMFKELVRKEPKHAYALAYLALLFDQLEGEHELAQSMAQQAQQLDPSVDELVAGLWEESQEAET